MVNWSSPDSVDTLNSLNSSQFPLLLCTLLTACKNGQDVFLFSGLQHTQRKFWGQLWVQRGGMCIERNTWSSVSPPTVHNPHSRCPSSWFRSSRMPDDAEGRLTAVGPRTWSQITKLVVGVCLLHFICGKCLMTRRRSEGAVAFIRSQKEQPLLAFPSYCLPVPPSILYNQVWTECWMLDCLFLTPPAKFRCLFYWLKHEETWNRFA